MTAYEDTLKAEVASWLIPDAAAREEKFRRERIRHFGLVRDLLLDRLGTEGMRILEVGGGPMPVSDLLRFRSRLVVDPLSVEYSTVLPCPDHVAWGAEEMDDITDEGEFDLVISTNALDHVETPERVIANMDRALKSGGYMAIMCAENNAITNPHPAHVHNLNADFVHRLLDAEYETAWELTYAQHGYRYGWAPWEGRRGQPAFALLMRKCSGY